MIQTVEKGKTLLIDGPASVHLISGKLSAFGALVKKGDRIIVRKGKRTPFEVLQNAQVELTLGDSASSEEIEGSTIPNSWQDIVNKIISTKEHGEILVIGGTDSGKTSFCTYLANKALSENYRTAFINGDLGQSDVGPPGTVSLGFIQEPIIDLFNLQLEEAIFIGVTSPSRTIDSTLNAIAMLKAKALNTNANFLVINTDGWIEGEAAVDYKVRLVKALAPKLVVAIQSSNELDPIIDLLRDMAISEIDSPKMIKKRDKETRRNLRELSYKKFLKGAKVRLCPLNRLEIKGELEINKRLTTLQERDVKGLLVGLENSNGKFLGIGTICNIDFKKGLMQIYTPISEAISKIHIGQIKLDCEGNEMDFTMARL
ncbi:MAG: Clp1/GlmU family protein [Candidatus Bathyarchaeia archaeon]